MAFSFWRCIINDFLISKKTESEKKSHLTLQLCLPAKTCMPWADTLAWARNAPWIKMCVFQPCCCPLPILTPAFLFWHRIKIACAFLVCCVCVCASVHAMWHMPREVTTLKWSFNRKIWMWVVIHLEASQICHHSILCWTKAKLQATFLKLQLFKNQIEEEEEEEEEEEKIFHAFSYFAHLANLWNA